MIADDDIGNGHDVMTCKPFVAQEKLLLLPPHHAASQLAPCSRDAAY